ncbi:MAG: NAD(P)H-hydrate epimerase [Nitrososphaeria archaeon]|nr:NAD(P)H-hydrate epimerase [Nitrososphaeria archaeon]NDF26837.1 NAD(P)H-hydrate epimerase [Nitrosopumilaceae archaeon]NDB46512.1 NAD(P)H-hydrate epimerase [Nitrososphaeria archaeon]NDB92164.1 NAD(P)H-hydrate epimerase [Nitrososphaeria archaeon]NDF29678.1 NAD(P)H-hydrate epimerase [Nitrososphaeria archaeon]
MEITVKQMYQIEENGHQMGFPRQLMMENAGASMVKRIVEKFSDILSKKVLVFAGLGNNGGDALVVARHLAGYGTKVIVILLGNPKDIKTIECRTNWQILEKMKSVQLGFGPGDAANFDVDIIIDGILGTGISGDIREPHASAIDLINKTQAFKIAVDVPSGVDPDTGNTANKYVTADMTVTFHKMKRGMPKKKELCGIIFVEKIGIPPEAEVGVL